MNQNARPLGSADWHLPSPSSTPTSATYTRIPCETPKGTAPQSQFYDVFRTPASKEGAFETPMGHQIGAKDVSSDFSSSVGATSFSLFNCLSDFNVQNSNHLLNPQTSGFVSTDATRNTSPVHPSGNLITPSSTAIDLANIQTPPPTRDSNYHNDQASSRHINFSTPSRIAPNGQSLLPNTTFPSNQTQASVFSYPDLQISPDTGPFMNSQFTTMPMDAQTISSWRPAFVENDANTTFQADFGSNSLAHDLDQPRLNWQTSDTQPLEALMSTQDPSAGFFAPNNHEKLTQDNNQCKPTESELTDGASDMPTANVDPALVFGYDTSYISPSKNTLPPTDNTHNGEVDHTNGQQVNKHIEGSLKNGQPKNGADYTPLEPYLNLTSSFNGSGLRRSNTDSAVRRRPLTVDSRLTAAWSREPRRRASPLKTNSNGILGSIPEITRPRSRASVILTVDEHGNARTETRLTSDRSVDSQYRQKYSDLWDETESDSDAEMPNVGQSFPQVSSNRSKRNASNSRSTNSHAETLGLLTSSTSNTGQNPGSRGRQRLNRTVSYASRRFSTPCFNKYFGEMPSKHNTEDWPCEDKVSSAQAALKQKKESRKRRSDYDHADPSAPNSKRWSMPVAGPLVSSSSFSSLNNLTANLNLASASAAIRNERADTAAFTSPVTEESSDFSTSSPSQQCIVCNSADARNGYMVRCDLCFKWLHAQCATALEREDDRDAKEKRHQSSSQYICFFCSGQASSGEKWADSNANFPNKSGIARNGSHKAGIIHSKVGDNRIRKMNQDQGIAFLSPLTHNSFHG